jgi:hypothetical protein
MELNNTILKILDFLRKSKSIHKISKYKNGIFHLDKLLSISSNKIVINKLLNVESKLLLKTSSNKNTVNLDKIRLFINSLQPHIVRLNHLGISYGCKNIVNEINQYKDSIKNSSYNLFEEDSGNPTSRWFFVGDTPNWENPLFEIVLAETNKQLFDNWNPHFQIDIDTDLTYENISKITNKFFGNNFEKWKLDIPDYGVVLTMGNLGEVSGTKIYLVIGTNIRGTKYHREKILKLI